MNTKITYKVGGSLDAGHPTYVRREAHQQLLDFLSRGEYCYVLNSRQMGKSTLAAQIIEELKAKEIISAQVDFSKLEQESEAEKLYESIASRIMLFIKNPGFNWNNYWDNCKGDSLTKLESLLTKLLDNTKKNIVIFLDEIDSIRLLTKLNTDSLFSWIRSRYNDRALFPRSNHITFCLIGVGTPSDFIQNKNITSFNIGNRIELRGFTYSQAEKSKLVDGLENCQEPKAVLREIIKWTNGQPLLTQHLCEIVSEDPETQNPIISDVVEKKYIISKTDPQQLFKTIEDRIVVNNPQTLALLEMYKRILEDDNKRIKADDLNPIQIELRLSGLVIRTLDGYLEPFNLIYQRIFDIEWVKKKLASIKPKYYAEKFEAWLGANEKIKERYLLYGKELESASQWSKDKQINNNENQFLNDSRYFLRDLKKGLLGDPDQDSDDFDYQAIIYAIFLWTGGIKSLNKIIMQSVKTIFKKKNKPINKGEEGTSLEIYITQRLNQSDTRFNKHRQEISDHILKGNNFDPVLVLWSYREILEQGEVEFNESPEHQKLIDICLIIKEGNKLQILNKIYPLLLNQDWINDQLKFIITDLVNKIWQSVTEDEQSQAVEIVMKFNPRLKGKTNSLYGFIKKVLENTVSNHNLLENLLEKACKQEYISSEHQDEWIKQQLNLLKPNGIIDQEILTWIQSYEKAIVSKHPSHGKAKEIIDIAFCKLVEQLPKEFEEYTEPQDRNINTVIHCIEYLTDNLIRLGIWKEDDRPNIQKEGENRWKITISNCSYQEECKWALDESAFNEGEKYKKYRCQRLGCCVGVVKEYMNENLNYSMETVVDEAKGCQGFIFGGFE